MEKYINETGESTITHYEIGEDFIFIKYKKDLVEYNLTNASKEQIEKMKELARKGKGLSRFISKYFSKEKSTQGKPTLFQSLKALFSFSVFF